MPNIPRPLLQELLLHPVTYREALGAIANLSEAQDVDLTAPPQDGFVLAWSATASKWLPAAIGSPSFEGVLPVTLGGTGGTTAAEARANLGLGTAATHPATDFDSAGAAAAALAAAEAFSSNASNLTGGTVPASRWGSGTRDSTTFARSDNTFARPQVLALDGYSASPVNGQLFVFNNSTGLLDPVDRTEVVFKSAEVNAKVGSQTYTLDDVIPQNMVGQVEAFKVEIVTANGVTSDAKVAFGTAQTPGLFGPSTYLDKRVAGGVYTAGALASDSLAAGTQLTGTIDVAGVASGSYTVRFVCRVSLWRSLS